MNNVDCYISENGYFIAPDYNIRNLIDPSESELSTMPTASESSVKIAGRDGDVVLSTTYDPILFNIVCFTEDNLTVEEKILEENKIKTFLNNIKNHTIKLGIENRNIYYNVKYSGSLTVVRYPKALRFSIPLKSESSYGKKIPTKTIIGNNSETSDTIKPVGAKFIISGPVSMPKLTFNNYLMEFDSDIVSETTLIIDTSKCTVTYIDRLNRKSNQIAHYNHQFPKVQNGTNTLQIISGISDENQIMVEWNDLTL